MQVVQVKKSPSWTTYLTGLEVGETILAEYSKRNTISPLISRQLSLSHPDRKWTSKKEVVAGKEYLEVKRIK
jgi:hypothetical protein